MNHKCFLLLLLCLIFLSGCNSTLLSTKQVNDAINVSGSEYGLVFEKAKEIPEMPDGAVLVFDADDLKKVITEVYLENNDFLKDNTAYRNEYKSRPLLFFTCEKERVLVVFENFYGLEQNTILFEIAEHPQFYNANMKNFILQLKEMKSWKYYSTRDFLWDNYNIRFYGKGYGDFDLGEFIFEQTHDDSSPYYWVVEETPDETIGQLFYDSLCETQELYNYEIIDLPIVTIGNKVNKETLPDGVWTVYCLPAREVWGNIPEPAIKATTEDLLFLLESKRLF